MCFAAQADEAAEAGRAVAEEHGDAVVTMSMTASMSFFGQEQQQEVEAPAMVIGADGLTVTSLAATDPFELVKQMLGGMMAEMGDFDFKTELERLELIFPDGTEVPADIVLRDKDLDLAFLRPREPLDEPVDFIDLSKGAEAQILDRVVLMKPLGKVGRRELSVRTPRIDAVIEKPWKLYVLRSGRPMEVVNMVGATVMDMDGRCLGLATLRGAPVTPMDEEPTLTIMVLPAEDLLRISKQAPEQAAEEEVKEEAAEAAEPAEDSGQGVGDSPETQPDAAPEAEPAAEALPEDVE
jgi:hypothetical protein